MKKNYGIAVGISIPLAVIIHYFIFSKANIHPTLQAFIGILLFFIILGIIVSSKTWSKR